MTHQEISDAFEAVYSRAREVAKVERQWIDSERLRLQQECATAGHIWGRSDYGLHGRACRVCNAWDPSVPR